VVLEEGFSAKNAMPGGELRAGDIGLMDEQGWFYLVDRKKDQINASGYKVWPREVEAVLYEHPAVREAAVVGVPDSYRGETVKAFVNLKGGASTDASTLIAFCKGRMAAYKYPPVVEILDELPKTASGKILRRELRRRSTVKGMVSHNKPEAAHKSTQGRPREHLPALRRPACVDRADIRYRGAPNGGAAVV
jgi:acyl-CoA synthetase (AMP-forming)/AMP-acid ligase II